MYNPPTFMTLDVLSEVLAEFSWPQPFTLESDLPDGIEVHLPRCTLYFTEGFESSMDVAFLPNDLGLQQAMPIGEALSLLRQDPRRVLPPSPKLIDFFSPAASLDKVKNELRDLCTLLLTYFGPTLEGDFGWAAGTGSSASLG